MSWKKEIEELRYRESLSFEMGGPEKIERQHHFGKLTIRERVNQIADKGSFHEIGTLAGVAKYNDEGDLEQFTPSNFVLALRRSKAGQSFSRVTTSPCAVGLPMLRSGPSGKLQRDWLSSWAYRTLG